jgi:hypothetical protein
MIKLGICREAQDTAFHRLWRRGLRAATLLATNDSPTAADTSRFERLMPQICLSSGVARTTARGRFGVLDREIAKVLRELYPAGSPLRVEDWAVSNGITAAEWFRVLAEDYPQLRFVASDWTVYLVAAEYSKDGSTYILEPDGTPIQYIREPFVVSLVQKHHWVYAVNRRVHQYALESWRQIGFQLTLPNDWNDFSATPSEFDSGPLRLRRLSLFHPEVLKLQSEQFRVCRHSVFDALSDPVDMIRTMNILNRAYFSDEQLQAAASAVAKSLRPGGVWIVGRSAGEHPGDHQVTICRRGEKGWQVYWRLGGGSEIEPLLETQYGA